MAKVKSNEEFFSSFGGETEEVVNEVQETENEEVEVSEDEVEEEVEDQVELEDSEEESEVEVEVEDEVVNESEEEEVTEDEDGILLDNEELESAEEANIETVSKELGFEGVTSKADFINKYNEAIEKARGDAFAGIPDSLKEAVAFAKEGGDFMSILSEASNDYDSMSNAELVRASAERYFTEDGVLDEEGLQEWFESKSKAEINMNGDQIRNQLKQEQGAKIAQIKEKAEREKSASRVELKKHIDSLQSIGGVKVRTSDREKLYNDTVTGLAMEEMFYENGKISERKLAENLFRIRSFDKAIALAKNSSKTDGKREVISKATNSQIKRPATKPAAEKIKVNPMDVFFDTVKNRK